MVTYSILERYGEVDPASHIAAFCNSEIERHLQMFMERSPEDMTETERLRLRVDQLKQENDQLNEKVRTMRPEWVAQQIAYGASHFKRCVKTGRLKAAARCSGAQYLDYILERAGWAA